MAITNHSYPRLSQWMRWIARGISTLAAAFWLLIFLDIIACDAFIGVVCLDWETALLVVIAAASVLSVVLAWRHEGIGGIIMSLWGLAFIAIAFVTSSSKLVYSILVGGLPFFVAGSLFMASQYFLGENQSSRQVGT